jgi:hypothetical protein
VDTLAQTVRTLHTTEKRELRIMSEVRTKILVVDDDPALRQPEQVSVKFSVKSQFSACLGGASPIMSLTR